MPCCKVTISKSRKCDKVGCKCIPTDGKSCVCLCENNVGDIVRCDDCKCEAGQCLCKGDNSKCLCIPGTAGVTCICVCHDEEGKIKSCNDCTCTACDTDEAARDKPRCVCTTTGRRSCVCVCKKDGKLIRCDDCECENDEECASKCDDTKCVCIPTKEGCCANVRTDESGNIKKCKECSCSSNEGKHCCVSKKCNKANCVCIPTDGKTCICVCKVDGKIIRCNDCECENDEECASKCDDTKCVCIPTKEGCCANVSTDESGNIKKCKECSCSSFKGKHCCASKKCNKANCVCIPTDGKTCICVCKVDGKIIRCNDCECENDEKCASKCNDTKCVCIPTKKGCCANVSTDESSKIQKCKECFCSSFEGKHCSVNKKCVKANCVCIPTDGKTCICVCKVNGKIIRCNDCECGNDEECASKFDDTKCVCISTKREGCVCSDDRSNIKKCIKRSCSSVEGKHCYVDKRCNKANCVCIPTDGKPCICVCKVDGKIIRCNDCECENDEECTSKCDDTKCVCIPTKGGCCVCVCSEEKGNIMTCLDCSCITANDKQSCIDEKASSSKL